MKFIGRNEEGDVVESTGPGTGYCVALNLFIMYDQLMVELRREDETALMNIMRMPPEMFDEL